MDNIAKFESGMTNGSKIEARFQLDLRRSEYTILIENTTNVRGINKRFSLVPINVSYRQDDIHFS
jgi:hypothetical protein